MAIVDVPRILFIDSYDSFTFNLAALCRRAIPGCIVYIIKNDAISFDKLRPLLNQFHAVIIGPGPGSPDKDGDIGIVKDVWNLETDHILPVFGVCLGMQSLALAFGATLKRLDVVKHGQVSNIVHEGNEIFKGVEHVQAVRYHSLHVFLNGDEPLEALAWADDQEDNGWVLMAVKHTSKPFWGVQYHPESVRTCGGGEDVIRNFWRLAKLWSTVHARRVEPWVSSTEAFVGRPWPHLRTASSLSRSPSPDPAVATCVLECPGVSLPTLCEKLGVGEESSDFVLLESAAQPGRYSIVGCLLPSTPKVTYRIGQHSIHIVDGDGDRTEDLGEDVWTWLSAFMRKKRVCGGGHKEVPFWGGFMGFLSYELGVHSLCPTLRPRLTEEHDHHPDVNLVFIERSIVIDSVTGRAYVQSLLPDDTEWIATIAAQIQDIHSTSITTEDSSGRSRVKALQARPPTVVLPDKESYIQRIRDAQDYLLSGDSYELCLTAPTRISITPSTETDRSRSSSWDLYKTLRKRNPAPHSAYLRLHPSTLLSSSPERFLSFSRPPAGVCQLRPIKGTVRKAPAVTRAVAEGALTGSVKEVAENLMIVDLIRHDLHGVVGDDVTVPQFCGVEEYETVWQMVSVIEGRLPNGTQLDDDGLDIGWEVLRQSLPPGSMTGAPKKRSVELLSNLEGCPRNIYSGVFGYWDVGGGGDWSVTIRSCFKYTEDSQAQSADAESSSEEWTLGAGGAITALSDPEAEWEEMIAKVQSVLPAFAATA